MTDQPKTDTPEETAARWLEAGRRDDEFEAHLASTPTGLAPEDFDTYNQLEDGERAKMDEMANEMMAKSEERFISAAGGNPPTAAQRAHLENIDMGIKYMGMILFGELPEGRNKSLALTALEDVQMRANRSVFQP